MNTEANQVHCETAELPAESWTTDYSEAIGTAIVAAKVTLATSFIVITYAWLHNLLTAIPC